MFPTFCLLHSFPPKIVQMEVDVPSRLVYWYFCEPFFCRIYKTKLYNKYYALHKYLLVLTYIVVVNIKET